MEKQSSKAKLLSFLPKSAAISFSSQPFSPGRDVKHRSHASNKGFSGLIISIVPVEERSMTRNGSFHGAQEPTSPKVSCIGQIKHKKKVCKAKREKKKELDKSKRKGKEQGSVNANSIMRRLFICGKIDGVKIIEPPVVVKGNDIHAGDQVFLAPSLGQLKKFSSGREAFSDFDYRLGVGGAAAVMGRHRGYFSDEEKGEESDEEGDGFLVPYSAPLGGGGVGKLITLEPKKEINIWKRRTMAPPRPLQV